MELTLGTETLVVAIVGNSFYHKYTVASKHHFGILSSGLSAPGPNPIHQPVTKTGTPQDKQ